MKYLVLISIILAIDISYAQKNINLQGTRIHKQVCLSDYASKIENVQLQTSDSCLLSDALSICCTDKFIFIQDFKTNMFYRFDRSGKFLNTIGRKGNGPFEYSKPFSFKIDALNDLFFIVDTYKKKILVYSFLGKYIDKIDLKYATNGIEFFNNNILYYNINYYKKESVELVLIDRNGNSINKTVSNSILPTQTVILELPLFYTFKKNVYYKNQLDDVIYLVDSKLNKIPVWKIDCGAENVIYRMNEKENHQNGLILKNIKEFDSYLFITYYQDSWYNAIYNKKDESVFIVDDKDHNGIVDDLSGGPIFSIKFGPFSPSDLIENTIVSVLQVEEICDIEKYKGSKFYKDVIASFDMDGNPIVRILTLK